MSIHINPAHKGLLHSKLGVPQGQHIPEAKLEAASHSQSPALQKEAQFAINAQHFHHGGGSGTQSTSHAKAVQAHIRSMHGK